MGGCCGVVDRDAPVRGRASRCAERRQACTHDDVTVAVRNSVYNCSPARVSPAVSPASPPAVAPHFVAVEDLCLSKPVVRAPLVRQSSRHSSTPSAIKSTATTLSVPQVCMPGDQEGQCAQCGCVWVYYIDRRQASPTYQRHCRCRRGREGILQEPLFSN